MDRRTLLRGFAGLAAVAVTGPSLAALSHTDRERLIAQMRDGGLIENQTFLIHDGGSVVLSDIRGLTIRNCRFIWTKRCEGPYIVFDKGCEDCTLDSCSFEGGADFGFLCSPETRAGIDVEVDSPDWSIARLPEGVRWHRA